VNQEAVRVLVVEDHRLVAESLGSALRTQRGIAVVALASTIAEAFASLERYKVDVILLDQRLPDGLGTEAVARIVAKYPDCNVIMVSASNSATVVEQALRAGCTGYITKGGTVAQLLDAIHTVRNGTTVISPEIAHRLVNRRGRASTMGVSQRQIDVLRCLADGLGSDQIAKRLFLSPNTVRNHIQSAIEVLGCHSRVQAVSEALRMGLIEGPE
jgi:DNA-binding NarL/FixJ family response regulator